MNRNDIKAAIVCAYRLGRLAEGASIRTFEPFVVTGRKVKQGNANAREIGYGTPEEQANRRNHVLKIWMDERKNHPAGTVGEIDNRTSQRLKADGYAESSSIRTIQRYRKRAGLTARKK
jgi:hypothetical protein